MYMHLKCVYLMRKAHKVQLPTTVHYLKKMAPSSYNWDRLQDEETVELSYRGNSEIMAIKLKLAPFTSGFLFWYADL